MIRKHRVSLIGGVFSFLVVHKVTRPFAIDSSEIQQNILSKYNTEQWLWARHNYTCAVF